MTKKDERYLITVNSRLANKLGYFGEELIRPNFLCAVIKILLGGNATWPIHIYYCGVPDEKLRKRFNIPKSVKNAYE